MVTTEETSSSHSPGSLLRENLKREKRVKELRESDDKKHASEVSDLIKK
jgi:hypothetical protein